MNLEEMGFRQGRAVECIVTTYNVDRSPNAAPMGIRRDSRGLILRAHSESDTCRNLLDRHACVINLVFDPLLFLRTALSGRGEGADSPEVDEREVKKAKKVDAPYLTAANAFIEAEGDFLEEEVGRDEIGEKRVSIFRLKAKGIVVTRPFPIAPNRGLSAAIELAIALSRGKKGEVNRWLEVMKRTMDEEEYLKIKRFLEALEEVKD